MKKCPYDEEYYKNYGSNPGLPYDRKVEHWTRFFGNIADWIVKNISPKKVLDVGCAKGFLVEALRDRGVDCYGIDISSYAISQVRDDIKPYCRVGSVLDPFPESHYDLITCIEVLEHLPEKDAEKAVENLCRHSDDIIFSSTPSDFKETTHVNVQPPEYWIKMFSKFGFYKDEFFDGSFVSPYCMRFRKRPQTEGMKVAIVSMDVAGRSACGFIRVLSPLLYCSKKFGLSLSEAVDLKDGRPFLKLSLDEFFGFDVVLFQRWMPCFIDEKWVEKLSLSGKVIVYDLDDYIFEIPEGNSVYSFARQNSFRIASFMEVADVITVSTEKLREFLVERFPHLSEKIKVLPNFIDLEIWGKRKPKPGGSGNIRFLFSGTPTHRDDLAEVEDAVLYILRKYEGRVSFEIWGGGAPEKLKRFVKRKLITSYLDYAKALTSEDFDFAVVPLSKSRFNLCKSNIKWLEFSVSGIPGIFSSIEPYSRSIVDGVTGVLVKGDTRDWVRAMELLISDVEWRDFIKRRAYEHVISNYSMEENAFRWFDLYVSAAEKKMGEIKPNLLSGLVRASSKGKPLCSIVIPVYNHLNLTGKCIKKLYEVTPSDLFELIVVDNGSKDGTREYLEALGKEISNIRVIRNEENLGFAKACNQGARAARGKYVVFLNNDTVPLKGWLEELIKVAEKDEKIGVVGSKLLFPDGTIQHAGVGIADFPYSVSPMHLYYGKPDGFPGTDKTKDLQAVTGACMLVRKSVFERLGGFDEGFVNGYEDVDLCLRVREAGYRVVYNPKSVLYHYESMTPGRFNNTKRNHKRLEKKWSGKVKPDISISPPEVSIVVLNHNGSEDTIRCLESLARLDYKGAFQVVVVDNGSDDADFERLRSWVEADWNGPVLEAEPNLLASSRHFMGEIVLIRLRENLGFSGGNNPGIEYGLRCGAKYVWVLNNDTVVDKDSLKELVAASDIVEKTGIVFSKIYSLDGKSVQYDGLSMASYEGKKGSEDQDRAFVTEYPCGCSMLLKKELLEDIGLFDEEYFLYFEDNDIMVRAKKSGWKAAYTPFSRVYHKGGGSIGEWLKTPLSVYYASRNALLIYKKNFPDSIFKAFSTIRNMGKAVLKDPVLLFSFVSGVIDFLECRGGKSRIEFEELTQERVYNLVKSWKEKDGLYRIGHRLILAPSLNNLERFLSVAEVEIYKLSNRLRDPNYMVAEGERLFKEGKVYGAISMLKRALELDSSLYIAHNDLAFIYWQMGVVDKALGHIVRAMELSPNDRDVVWNAGQIMIGVGRIRDACEIFKGYLKSHPEDKEVKELLRSIGERVEGL